MSESAKPCASHANGDRNPLLPQQLSELVFVSSTVLQQALDLVNNILTDDHQLTVQSKYLPGSTIGTLFARIPHPHFNVVDNSNRKTPPPCARSLHAPD